MVLFNSYKHEQLLTPINITIHLMPIFIYTIPDKVEFHKLELAS